MSIFLLLKFHFLNIFPGKKTFSSLIPFFTAVLGEIYVLRISINFLMAFICEINADLLPG